jgi:hypothetical protein
MNFAVSLNDVNGVHFEEDCALVESVMFAVVFEGSECPVVRREKCLFPSSCQSVHPPGRLYQRGSHGTNSCEI